MITYNGNIVTCPSGKWVGAPEGPWPVPNYYDNCVEVVLHLVRNQQYEPAWDMSAVKARFENWMTSNNRMSVTLTAEDSYTATYKVTWGTGRTEWGRDKLHEQYPGAFYGLMDVGRYYFDVTRSGILNGTNFSRMFAGCMQERNVCGLCTVDGTDFSGMFEGSNSLIPQYALTTIGLPDLRKATNLDDFMYGAYSYCMTTGYLELYDVMSRIPSVVSHLETFKLNIVRQYGWPYNPDLDDQASWTYVYPPPEWPGFAELDQIPASWGGLAP